MIKALSEPKPETPKPETKPRIKIKTDKEKLRKLRKDFDELRHNFSKKEIDRYKKVFLLLLKTKNIFLNQN